MKTALSIAMILVATLAAQGSEESKKQLELKAKAALELKIKAKKSKFVNVAPVPREIPEPMPGKKCDTCKCEEKCKCESAECDAKKPIEKTPETKREMVIVGYRVEQQCIGGVCQFVQVPVYGYR